MVKSAYKLIEGQNSITFDDIIGGDSPKMQEAKKGIPKGCNEQI